MTRRFNEAFLAAMLTAFCAACGGDPGAVEDTQTLGEVSLQLNVGALKFNSARYKITGPRGSIKSGTIALQNSSRLSAVIGGLPAAVGYTVDLSTVSSNATTSCSGSGRFDVVAHKTTPVDVELACRQAPVRGSVSVNGTFNVCPVITSVSAKPSEVPIGGTSALSAVATDSDGPEALHFQWTTSAAELDSSIAAQATFRCLTPGLATIIVSVSDGDPLASCLGYGSTTVDCSAPASN